MSVEHKQAIELIEEQLEIIEENKEFIEVRIENAKMHLKDHQENLYQMEIEKRELKHTLQLLKGEYKL